MMKPGTKTNCIVAAGVAMVVAYVGWAGYRVHLMKQANLADLATRVTHCEQAAVKNHITPRACTWIRGQYWQAEQAWF